MQEIQAVIMIIIVLQIVVFTECFKQGTQKQDHSQEPVSLVILAMKIFYHGS